MILAAITVEDVLDMFQKKDMTTTINDGKIVGFEPAEEKKVDMIWHSGMVRNPACRRV